jgi:separase
MTDFFEVKSLSLLRLQSLHLLLKLQLYLSAGLDVIIPIYASLALQYVRLGYTGKAGTVFAQGLKQIKDSEPSTTTQLAWHLHYAEYFARISNIVKAKEHMSEAGKLYAREFSSPKKRISSAERAERVLAVGRAGFVLSLIAFEENQLETAIGHVDYAIRVLKTGITAVERSAKAKVISQDYDPFSSERPPPMEKTENTGIQFGSKLWSFKSVTIFLDDVDSRPSSRHCYKMVFY